MMEFRKIGPPPVLRPYIQYFWTLEHDGNVRDNLAFITVADGLPGLTFQQFERDQAELDGFDLPTVYLYGQSVKPNKILMPGRFQAIGVYFYPNALQAVFGLPAHEWTNGCLGLDLLDGHSGKALADRLLNSGGADDRIALLADYLHQRVLTNRVKQDSEAIYAVKQIRQSNGNLNLRKLQEDLRISERGFERKFQQAIGIAPKLFSRICQFQAALDYLRAGRFARLTDVAFAAGYADQSHFIRNFNAFTGLSPRSYLRVFVEKLPNFPQHIA